MKKWMYIIFPGAMLVVFLILFNAHKSEAEAKERVRLEEVAKKKALEDEKKAAAEKIAQEDAQKRQKEREEADRQKEEERRRKQEAADQAVRDQTAKFRAEADESAKKAGQLEIELDRLHKEKDQLSRADFDLAKQVELAKVAKRNAELEEQRMTAMIAQRAQASTMAQMPAPPPPPK